MFNFLSEMPFTEKREKKLKKERKKIEKREKKKLKKERKKIEKKERKKN